MAEIILRIVFFLSGSLAGGVITFIILAICMAAKDIKDDDIRELDELVRNKDEDEL